MSKEVKKITEEQLATISGQQTKLAETLKNTQMVNKML